MKRITIVMTVILLMLSLLAACGGGKEEGNKEEKEKGCEIAVISESVKADGEAFVNLTWDSAKKFADQNDMVAALYEPEEVSKEAYMASIEKATKDGAKFIILAGSAFETTAYDAQKTYPDIGFMILDGVPHDEKDNYATADNTVSVIFAEEEAGYMAGYAAVKEGYKKLGFLGGQEAPYVKRYGYGFLQGAAAAAAETETKVEMAYRYMGSSEASKDVREVAQQWYKDGTEVIFVSGGPMTDSVVKAAEKAKGKVIATDLDDESLSETVIASASKGIGAAVETVLKSYEDGTFTGGTAFNYAAKNDGVSLQMSDTGFTKFDDKAYKKVFRSLSNGKIELKKDTGVKSISELTGEWVTIKK